MSFNSMPPRLTNGHLTITYEAFYGLRVDPFRLSPDHRFCYSHRSYARAKAYMQYALQRPDGFVVITGQSGIGKTTLVHDLLATLPNQEVMAGPLMSTAVASKDFLLAVGDTFGLDVPATERSLRVQELNEFLNHQHQQGIRTLLIIDEAQDLSHPALEELQLLANLQRDGAPLLQIFLLGQHSLQEILWLPAMEYMRQRMTATWRLEALELKETFGYVLHRLKRAGWTGPPPFEPGALRIVHQFSGGIPRRINQICGGLLLHGLLNDRHTLTAEDAEAVVRDLNQEELTRPADNNHEDTRDISWKHRSDASGAAKPDFRVSAWKKAEMGLAAPIPPDDIETQKAPAEAEFPPMHLATAISTGEQSTERDPSMLPMDVRPSQVRYASADATSLEILTPNRRLYQTHACRKSDAESLRCIPAYSAKVGMRLLPWVIPLFIVVLAMAALFLPADMNWRNTGSESGQRVDGKGALDTRPPMPPGELPLDASPISLWEPPTTGISASLPEATIDRATPVSPEPASHGTAAEPVPPETISRVIDSMDRRHKAPAPLTETILDSMPRASSEPSAQGMTARDVSSESPPRLNDSEGVPTDWFTNPENPALTKDGPTSTGSPDPALSRGSSEATSPVKHAVLMNVRVLFRFDDVKIQPASEPLLAEAADILRAHEETFAEIIGSTDDVGDPIYNEWLAKQRAQSVADWLEARGISEERLHVSGSGQHGWVAEDTVSRRESRMAKITVKKPKRQ